MDPLPLKTRRSLAILSSLIFVIVLAAAALYATGYGFNFKKLTLIETGAIHLAVPISDATVSLNGKEVGKSSLITHGFFLDTLTPGDYVIEARATGYYPWAKHLVVAPKIVTDTETFMVPITLTYERAAFPPAPLTTSTSTREEDNGVTLSIENGTAVVHWTRDPAAVPSSFCVAPGACVQAFILVKGGVTNARFFARGVVYETAQGVYLAEIDVKDPRLTIPLDPKKGATFRIDHRHLFLKDPDASFEVSGF